MKPSDKLTEDEYDEITTEHFAWGRCAMLTQISQEFRVRSGEEYMNDREDDAMRFKKMSIEFAKRAEDMRQELEIRYGD